MRLETHFLILGEAPFVLLALFSCDKEPPYVWNRSHELPDFALVPGHMTHLPLHQGEPVDSISSVNSLIKSPLSFLYFLIYWAKLLGFSG